MDTIDEAILNALKVNMGYKDGEGIVVIGQSWNHNLGEERKEAMQRNLEVAERMFTVLNKQGYSIKLLTYTPEIAEHGADVTQEVYDQIGNPQVVFMPTHFSLTQANFTEALRKSGSKIASMPTFTLDMFAERGPMAVDYKEIDRATKEVAEKLRAHKYIEITAEATHMIVEIDQELVHESSGLLTLPGSKGNLPGAEAYVVPVHLGNSHGYFTVPKGWGGLVPLEYSTTFYVKNGKFDDVVALSGNEEKQAWVDKHVNPLILESYGAGQGADVLAELGQGLNTNVTADYIKEHGWSALLAEKISQSCHFANGKNIGFGGKNNAPRHIDWVVPNIQTMYTN